jgi:hypothetical protein
MLELNKLATHILAFESDLIDKIINKIGTIYILEEDALMVFRLLMKADKKAPRVSLSLNFEDIIN